MNWTKTKLSFRTLAAVVFVLALSIQSLGQEQIQFTTGKVEEKLSHSINIPLFNYPGRGLDLPVSLSYSSNVWRIDLIKTINYSPISEAIYADRSTAGWRSSLDLPKIEFPKDNNGYYTTGGACSSCYQSYVAMVTIHMPDGSSHVLRRTDTPGTYIDPTGVFYAVDGSRIKYVGGDLDSGTVYMPDGTRYEIDGDSGSIIDKFGNTMTYSGTTRKWTDTIGRIIDMPFPANPAVDDYEYKLPGLAGVNGGFQTYTFKFRELEDSLTPDANNQTPSLKAVANYYLPNPSGPLTGPTGGNWPQEQTGSFGHLFSAFHPGEGAMPYVVGRDQAANALFNPIVLKEVVLPDGRSYKFTYNVYGEIDTIIYPIGALEKLQMAGLPSSWDDSGIASQAVRGVVNRKVSENGTGTDFIEWKYSKSFGIYEDYIEIAPDNTRTVTSCYSIEAPIHNGPWYRQYWDFGYEHPMNGAVAEKRFYSTSSDGLGGSLFRRQLFGYAVSQTYLFTHLNGLQVYAYRNLRPTRETEIIFEGSGSALARTKVYEYDISHEMDTGVDQIKTKFYNFAVVSNSSPSDIAQSGTIAQIPIGNLAKTIETTYSDSSTFRDANILGVPTVVEIKDASDAVVSRNEMSYDDEGFVPNGTNRAMPTTVRTWDSTIDDEPSNPNAYVVTHTTFDAYGNATIKTDANGNATTTTYDPTHHVYPISVTSPVPDSSGTHGSNSAFTTSTSYDTITGLVLSTTDPNAQTTTVSYVDPNNLSVGDPFLRPRKVTAPNGHQTIMEYGLDNSSASRWVREQTQIDETRWKERVKWFDGLGRTVKTQSVDAQTGDVFVETEYDNMGRPKRSTNPYRNGETIYWTENTFDTAGRPWKVTTPDGAVVETTYGLATVGGHIGTVVTVEDQADKLRRSITNALGQLIRVDEPNNAGQIGTVDAPDQPTYYVYDTLNNLTTVNQGIQTRTFTYDSLSRLKSTTNPESGTINYTYDANSNLATKTDARSIITTYAYDALNRVTQRQYTNEPSGSETPDVSYFYDSVSNAKGKLTTVSSSVSTTEYTSFDILGRVTSHKQTTEGGDPNGYTTGYTYNLSGGLIKETYPSGRVVKNVLGISGDLATVQSKKNATAGFWNYAQHFTYNAAGAVTSMQLGNGRWESTVFNSRLQPTRIALGTVQNGTDKLNLQYAYGQWEGGVLNAAKNNGNVAQQLITVARSGQSALVFDQKYTYDSLNRITSAEEKTGTTTNWMHAYTFDRYGNRNFNEALTTTLPKNCGTEPNLTVCPADVPIVNPAVNTGNNRLNGTTYDAAGNVIVDAEGRRFKYDSENKQIEATNSSNETLGTYYFDGDGKRVKKVVPSTGETTIFVYEASGKLVAEYSTSVVPQEEAKVQYQTLDHLGTPRINTDQNGNIVSRADYMPYGEEIIALGGRSPDDKYVADDVRQGFTGYINDDETTLDYAQARMFSSRLGRFTGVDPLHESAEFSGPQTWNRYTYVLNNPLMLVDPDGQKWEFADEKLKKAFEAAVKAKGTKAWKAYQAIENNKGLIKVGFGSVEKGVATTKLSGEIDAKGNLTLNGEVTLSKDSKALDSSNATDLSVASAHEFNHILSTLAGLGAPGFASLAPPVTTTPDEQKNEIVNFKVEVAAYQVEGATEKAMKSKGQKPLTPGTVLERNARSFAELKTPAERYDYLTSVGYKFKEARPADPKPGPRPANRNNTRTRRRP